MKTRSSGLLMAISSLPSKWGIGDFGPEAHSFAELLERTQQKYWQILPLTVTDAAIGNSPYNSPSAFGGNPLYISPEVLVDHGLLLPEDLEIVPEFPQKEIHYDLVAKWKRKIFQKAFHNFQRNDLHGSEDFLNFCSEQSSWLDDFALFFSIKGHMNGKAWNHWPEPLRTRQEEELNRFSGFAGEEILYHKFLQYTFQKQWESVRTICRNKGIHILGDMPIYVSYDSVDVWSHQDIFQLDPKGDPIDVSGVPPDYFSETGQLWGNPLYEWGKLLQTDFSWWKDRIHRALDLYDSVRIDHFRGLVAYWAIPRNEVNAVNGKWIHAPVHEFFDSIKKHFGYLPFVAEDLGIITEDVRDVMNELDLPGMLVLQFCFDNFPSNLYAPHNHSRNRLVYTGTHDNNTVRGWFENEASEEIKNILPKYLGREPRTEEIHLDLIRMALFSVADTAIIPVQDLLGLGGWARMNNPSRSEGNWKWRLEKQFVTDNILKHIRELTFLAGRGK
ncbi:MAG TPA: 4-alpha-glucanotransferase [Synergistales bacterium]|nr:4-alpha-glucanotransferase [Synergistales bacterium]